MKIKKMSYEELENKLIANRITLRNTNDAAERRSLVSENHRIMTELNNRFVIDAFVSVWSK